MSWAKTIVGAIIAGSVAAVLLSGWDFFSKTGDMTLSPVDARFAEEKRHRKWINEVKLIVRGLVARKLESQGIRAEFPHPILLKELDRKKNTSEFEACGYFVGANGGATEMQFIFYSKGYVEYDDEKFHFLEDRNNFTMIEIERSPDARKVEIFCRTSSISPLKLNP